jgi:hypothetical protein
MPSTTGETADTPDRFEATNGSHAVEVTTPEDRQHIDGLLDAMDEWDADAHKRGDHDDDPREDCPLCVEEESA